MEASPPAAPPGRLLIVEDEAPVLRALVRALSGEGWALETATDGEKALTVAEHFRPDVVISDFRMPGMNGVEVLARLADTSVDVQRILLTGQADQRAAAEAINRAQVFRFLQKPWDNNELLAAVRLAFEHRRLVLDNAQLLTLTQKQNEELRAATVALEARVAERTFALARAKREWEVAFDAIHLPLSVVDEGMRVRRGNRALAQLSGRPVQVLGERPPCHELQFGRAQPCVGCPLPRALRERRPSQGTVCHEGREYEVTAYPVPEEDAAVCTYRDVTEHKERLRRQVETEKLAAVDQLAGGVAHEVNNPLGAILAFAQLMKKDQGRTAADVEALDLIEESALRCSRIVEGLLKFSRRSEDRRPLDLSHCMQETADLFRAQLAGAPRARLELDLAQGLPRVVGSAGELGQVALNLLQNALQALPDSGGLIRLETGRLGSACFVRVSDSGTGIPPEDLPRVFDPWFTTRRPGEGPGLGLALAHQIVADHGGSLQAESAPGHGATFTAVLPALN